MTRWLGCNAALFGIGVTVLLGPALVAAAPVLAPIQTLAQPSIVAADFTVTYSYDQNGNRLQEKGPPTPEQSGADKCGNGTLGLVPLFLNGRLVSMYPGTCP